MVKNTQKRKRRKNRKALNIVTASVIGGILLIGMILFACFSYKVDSNIVSMVGSICGVVASSFLGVVALWQNHQYKKDNDCSNERYFRHWILSDAPYYSIFSLKFHQKEIENYNMEVELKNETVFPISWSQISLIEIYKEDKVVYELFNDDEFSNIKAGETISFLVENIKLKENNSEYIIVFTISLFSSKNVQYDQELKGKLKLENSSPKFISQIDSKFLENLPS